MGVADRVGRAAQETVEDLLGTSDSPAALLEQAARALDRHARAAHEGLARRRAEAQRKREMAALREEEAGRFQARAQEARQDGLTVAVAEAEGFLAKARAGAQSLGEEAARAEAEVADLERSVAAVEEAAREVRRTRDRLAVPLARLDGLAAAPAPPPPRQEPSWRAAAPGEGPDPEVEFERIRRKDEVEERLAALKRKVKGGG
jgi:phage shock protein A